MRGGVNPCVTDANILLGKLNQKKILGGRMEVDLELAKLTDILLHDRSQVGVQGGGAHAGILPELVDQLIRPVSR